MLRLVYEAMRRRSELCRFRFEDLEVQLKGQAALLLRFSKTDQAGQDKSIPISGKLFGLIEQWRERVGGEGYLLRGAHPHSNSMSYRNPRDGTPHARVTLR